MVEIMNEIGKDLSNEIWVKVMMQTGTESWHEIAKEVNNEYKNI